MRILLSAYACEPDVGSEQAVAWNISNELAALGHEVTVITCGGHHRAPIEAWCDRHPERPPVRFLWHDVPGFDAPGFTGNGPIRRHYMAWQRTAPDTVATAIARGAAFDVVHHLTWGSWRMPSQMGRLGLPFVLGPIGGMIEPAAAMRASFSPIARRWEHKRDLVNLIARLHPGLWRSFAQADRILVSDRATGGVFRWPFRSRTQVLNHVACLPPSTVKVEAGPPDAGIRLLWVGRIEDWKGLPLAIGAFARLLKELPRARFTIIGGGPDAAHCEEAIQRLGIAGAIDRIQRVPHADLPAIYARHDLLMAPSTRDIGGIACAEALSNGLPVLAFDRGDRAGLVDDSCGVLVRDHGTSRDTVEAAMADAIIRLAQAPARLARLRDGARARAGARGWDTLARSFVEQYHVAIATREVRGGIRQTVPEGTGLSAG